MYPPGKSLDCIYVYMSNNIETNGHEKGREKSKKKIFICDLILLPGSSNTHYLQLEDLQVPTGDKNTENTSEKMHSTTC